MCRIGKDQAKEALFRPGTPDMGLEHHSSHGSLSEAGSSAFRNGSLHRGLHPDNDTSNNSPLKGNAPGTVCGEYSPRGGMREGGGGAHERLALTALQWRQSTGDSGYESQELAALQWYCYKRLCAMVRGWYAFVDTSWNPTFSTSEVHTG